jgi:restriction endonuclease S subunit
VSSVCNFIQTNLSDVRADYLLKKGDVLFASRGERRRAAVVEEYLPNTIFSSQLLACATDESVLPAYLAWYINQQPAQRYLDENATGSYIRNVTKDAFGHLLVPVPPLETQRKIVEIYRLGLRENQLLEEIRKKRGQLVELALLQSIHKP